MSRTDKDVPDWYTVEYYEPFHRCGLANNSWYRHDRDCDLPELTWATARPVRGFMLRRRYCEWLPIRPAGTKKWYNDNPGWWYRQVWLEPERGRVRDQCTEALQDYNANGDTEVDIADFQKKHNGGWFW